MEELEMLEQTNDTENVDTLTTEELVEGIELTDTADTKDVTETQGVKTLRELLQTNPDYQEEFNGMIKDRLSKKDRQYKRDLAKYQDIENVLRNTIGGDDLEGIRVNLRNAYSSQGIDLPEEYNVGLSEEDYEVLARNDAELIIKDGFEAMEEEANRLAAMDYKNLNPREKMVFKTLVEKISQEKDMKELLSIGAKIDVLNSKEFKEFKEQFKSDVPITTIYTMFKGNKPKQVIDNPGSMRNDKVKSMKTTFTDEDIAKMTDEELEANWDAIRAYQTREK
jgi:hypothetical protein